MMLIGDMVVVAVMRLSKIKTLINNNNTITAIKVSIRATHRIKVSLNNMSISFITKNQVDLNIIEIF